MKPPRYKKDASATDCDRCLFVGRVNQFDIWVCDTIKEIMAFRDDGIGECVVKGGCCSEDLEDKHSQIISLARPYFNGKKFTSLYRATLKIRS
jgi:hypothetical protein